MSGPAKKPKPPADAAGLGRPPVVPDSHSLRFQAAPPKHTHVCTRCEWEWVCDFPLVQCRARGVIKAAQVNRLPIICLLCYHEGMAERVRANRAKRPLGAVVAE